MLFQRKATKIFALLLTLLFNVWTPTASAALNDQYAMVFFFRSDCPYCHQFAPTLKQFSQINGLQTYAFSLDGKALNEYPVPIPATPEISQMFFENPRSITVPATFLINVNSRKFVRVSIGNVSEQELTQSVNGIFNDPSVLEAMQ
ncbi:type-F conjugative transfer system pilin assembly thiol-disulfide isomerase TrbB [Vibrio mediterranei]|uniref:type-F conjugative transfer system pilin assembly thiol-disulfide isomerase TrbB n=1 Tax=Vibrio mediterranei TaxID=689 RepID=UPI00406851E8